MIKITVLALLAAATAALPAAAAEPDGAVLFKRHCGVCHTGPADAATATKLGPHLQDLAGKTAGSTDFRRYSPAMKASKLVWDAGSLDQYLKNPRAAVRGTTMAFPGLRKEDERKAVIDYLLNAEN